MNAWFLLILASLFEMGWPLGFKLTEQPAFKIWGWAIAIVCMGMSGWLLWLDAFLVGTSGRSEGFIHASLDLLAGRLSGTCRQLAAAVVEALQSQVAAHFRFPCRSAAMSAQWSVAAMPNTFLERNFLEGILHVAHI